MDLSAFDIPISQMRNYSTEWFRNFPKKAQLRFYPGSLAPRLTLLANIQYTANIQYCLDYLFGFGAGCGVGGSALGSQLANRFIEYFPYARHCDVDFTCFGSLDYLLTRRMLPREGKNFVQGHRGK